MAIYIEKTILERLKLAQASWSLPREAGCLAMKLFHGPGEPDASLGELGSRKIQKRPSPPPPPWYLFIFLIKTLSDFLLHAITGI